MDAVWEKCPINFAHADVVLQSDKAVLGSDGEAYPEQDRGPQRLSKTTQDQPLT